MNNSLSSINVDHSKLMEPRLFIKDLKGRYVYCNADFAEDLGLQAEEITGKNDFLLYPSDMAEQYRFDDQDVMRNGSFIDCHERYQVKGREYWVHTTKVPLFKKMDGIQGVLGLILVVSQIPGDSSFHDGFWMLDEKGYIFGWDKTACFIMGVSNREIFGKHITEIGIKRSREVIRQRIKEIGDTGEGSFHTTFQGQNRQEKEIAITAVYWEEQKKFLGYVNHTSEKKNQRLQMNQIQEDLDMLKRIMAQLEDMYEDLGMERSGYSLQMTLKTILPLVNQLKIITPQKQQDTIRKMWNSLLTL